ncbi:MAG: FIST N-terminal domain-containing protein [Candidatus Odinarchaeota archaeon]
MSLIRLQIEQRVVLLSMESIVVSPDNSEDITFPNNECLVVAHANGRNLLEAVQSSAEDLAAKMGKPELLMFFPSSYDPIDKKSYEQACKILKKMFPDSQMCGGLFGSTFSNEGYSMRGVTLVGLKNSDLSAEVMRIKNLRSKSKKKGKKVAKKLAKRIKPENNAVVIFGGSGPNYPPFLLNQMNRPRKIHAFMMMNSSLFLKFPFLGKMMGNVMGRAMDRLNIGTMFNPINKFLVELNKQNKGIRFAGGSVIDTWNYRSAPVFINFKVSYKDSFLILLQSETLKFGLSVGNGAVCNNKTPESEIKFGNNMPGGFVFKIDGKWAREAMFDRIKMSSDLYYKNMGETIYVDSYHPIIVDYPESDRDHIMMVGMNPNLKASMYTLPDSVVDDLRKGKAKAFIGYQSATSVAETATKTLNQAKEEQGIEKIEFGLVFECINRMLMLGDQFRKLVKNNKDFFGNIPFVGVTTSGEYINGTVPTNNCSVVCLVAGR